MSTTTISSVYLFCIILSTSATTLLQKLRSDTEKIRYRYRTGTDTPPGELDMAVMIRNPKLEQELQRLRRLWFKDKGRKGSMAAVAEQLIAERLQQIETEDSK